MTALRPLLGCTILAGCAAAPAEPAPSTPTPNFVLIVADDQGFGEVGHRGHPWIRTPALDAMAAAGLSLERFYAAAPTCSPTRASLLTGRHPVRTRTFAWGHELPAEERTLAEALRERGYATGHFGKWHLGSVRAGAPTSPGAQGFETWASSPNFFDLDPALSVGGTVVDAVGDGSDVVTEHATAFLRAAVAAGRPFLAVVWLGNPHLPHAATPADLEAVAHAPEDARAYCAEFVGIDRCVGTLRATLRELDVADDTLVWFTSDNGPRAPGSAAAHATGGLRGAKGSLWEGGLRVPSLVVWPRRVPAGTRSDAVTCTSDVSPTLLELAGADAGTATLDGTSLAALLEGPDDAPGRAIGLGFWDPPLRGRVQHAGAILEAVRAGERHPEEAPAVVDLARFERAPFQGRAAWLDGTWKLHAIPGEDVVRFELYDLDDDPGETRDLAAERPEVVARTAAALRAWQRGVLDDLGVR